MTKTQHYLGMVKERLGLTSDYQLAAAIEVNKGRISEMMKGTKHATPYVAFKIAEILSLEPACVLAEIESESAPTEQQKDYWKGFVSRVGRQAAGIAALALLGSFSASYTPDTEAAFGQVEMTESSIMRNWLMRLRRWSQALACHLLKNGQAQRAATHPALCAG